MAHEGADVGLLGGGGERQVIGHGYDVEEEDQGEASGAHGAAGFVSQVACVRCVPRLTPGASELWWGGPRR